MVTLGVYLGLHAVDDLESPAAEDVVILSTGAAVSPHAGGERSLNIISHPDESTRWVRLYAGAGEGNIV